MIVFGNLDFVIIKFNQKGVVYDKLLNIYYIYCDGETPIFWATIEGHTEIVKMLAPLTDNPNASTNSGNTPIKDAKNKDIHVVSFNISINHQNTRKFYI